LLKFVDVVSVFGIAALTQDDKTRRSVKKSLAALQNGEFSREIRFEELRFGRGLSWL
jgi:hypothetical protein